MNCLCFNPFQDRHFRDCSPMWEGGKKTSTPFPKVSHTYLTKIKLETVIPYLKKIQKYMNHITHPLSSAANSISSREISNCRYVKKYRNWLSFNTPFLRVFKCCFSKFGYNFDDVSKIATLDLIKIKIFWNNGFIIRTKLKFCHVNQNVLLLWSCDQNSIRQVSITSILYGLDQKN